MAQPIVPFAEYVAHSANGTYFAYECDAATSALLDRYQQRIGLSLLLPRFQPVKSGSYHCTILYSKNPVPECKYLPTIPDQVVTATKRLTTFPAGKDGNVPVILLLANPLFHHIQQHLITNYGAHTDYPSFQAHVTLGYCHDCKDDDCTDINQRLTAIGLPEFELRFDRRTCKPLDND